ncbi:MAG: DUF63 family protein [Candidatus Poseidoniaceae archaeon]|nr:DUF63 family protein [Candidatus Poseidoniaceae archaeon]
MDEVDAPDSPNHDAALPDEAYSLVESVVLWALLAIGFGVVVGLVVAPEVVWDDGLAPVVWDPIVEDASDTGDAGYNPWNTMLYTAGLFAAVLALQALFRRWRLPSDDLMVLALTSWVVLAPVLRVLEDAHMFPEGRDLLYISPLIHLHLAAWLVGVGLLAHRLDVIVARSARPAFSERRVHHALLVGLPLLLAGFWVWVLQPIHETNSELVIAPLIGSAVAALVCIVLLLMRTTHAPALTRALLAFGSGAVLLSLGYYIALSLHLSDLYADDPYNAIVLWPLLVIVVVPCLVGVVLHRLGASDLRHLRASGHEPGVLPAGISLKHWEADPEAFADHPVERLSNRAMLASPLVILMVVGQLSDGLATFLGLDVFGYGEKHVASQGVIDIGSRINERLGIDFGVGAWFFAVIKITLVSAIVVLFSRMRVEHRQQHLRVLVVLAVMIVGLAPGLRDVGRLILDV